METPISSLAEKDKKMKLFQVRRRKYNGGYCWPYNRSEATMKYEDLTAEQRAKAGACNTPEELLAFVKEEGIELSEKDLDQITGGSAWGAKTGGLP